MPDLLNTNLSFPKIFVTGIYGGGKSTTAHTISKHTNHPYQNFDKLWSYSRKPHGAIADDAYISAMLHQLGPRFIIDAIPFNSPASEFYLSFNKFYQTHSDEILIICALCRPLEKWLLRIAKKSGMGRLSQKSHIANYIDFHINILTSLNERNILYYETVTQTYLPREVVDEFVGELRKIDDQ